MSWVQALIEWLRQFWPFVIVMHYERGVRYWRGQIVGDALEPDWYWCVPFFMHVETIPVKPDILKLWNLNVSTKDDRQLRVRANIRYELFDAVKAWNEVQDYKDNLGDEARTHLSKVVRERDYADLLADQATVEREAKNAMNAVVKEWGIKVIRCSITDFTKTRDISLASV
jgi:regulator of protease activity HflC (stomatin/prohibitin superfamily)